MTGKKKKDLHDKEDEIIEEIEIHDAKERRRLEKWQIGNKKFS